MDRLELQKRIVAKMKELGWIGFMLNSNQPVWHDAKLTYVELVEDGLVVHLANEYYYNRVAFIASHTARLETLEILIDSNTFSADKFAGYVTKNNEIHIADTVTNGTLRQYIMINNKPYINTSDCDWFKCTECHRLIVDNRQHIIEGRHLCDRCYYTEGMIVKCPICGEETFKWNMKNFYSTDAKFRELVENTLNVKFNEANVVKMCLKCYNKHFLQCHYCGTTKLKKNEEEFCECRNRTLYDYSYKPSKPIFMAMKKPKKNTLFLGFENECEVNTDDYDYVSPCDSCPENRDECGGCDEEDERRYDIDYSVFVKALTSVLGPIVYCKTDGSLNSGFEIITEPMTYDFIMKNKEKFKQAFKKISKLGAYSYNADTTGFHIHLSKQAFINQDHIEKFAYLIHKDIALSEIIAKRESCSYGYIKKFEKDIDILNYIRKEMNDPHDRYKAVNFCNRNTIEVRIYKGNLNMDSVILYIQHVVSLFNYTALVVKKHTDVSIDKYIKYVYNRGNKFKELKKEIKRIQKIMGRE